jgi:protein translocase SEC61 complex gamma subunit
LIKINPFKKFKEYWRVLKITKRPEKDEIRSTLRICLIGIGIIGAIGFILYFISSMVGGL